MRRLVCALCLCVAACSQDAGPAASAVAVDGPAAADAGAPPDLTPAADLASAPDLAPLADLAPSADLARTPDLAPAVNPISFCPVGTMDQDYSGALPPNPYGAFPEATDCMLRGSYDVIMILGCPNNSDGTPSSCQTARVDIAIGLMNAGRGNRFIVSGAAAHNQYVEAETLATLLMQKGVPSASIYKEPKAMHTDENIYYSTKIMEAQGWTNAIVVSDDPGHIVMTALCDSNCCVDLGRLTVTEYQIASGWKTLGHYVRYPWAATVSTGECNQIEQPFKFMCTNMSTRLACAADFKL
jgi:hypothetical protein